MTMDDLANQLDGVRRTPRGIMARCPSHDDHSPSLAIKEGERGVLVKCWAGCTLKEICAALGIRQTDLFFDSLADDPRQRRNAARQREAQRRQREAQHQREGLLIDALREADYFIRSRRGLDISNWSHQRLDDEMNALADAYEVLAHEDLDEPR